MNSTSWRLAVFLPLKSSTLRLRIGRRFHALLAATHLFSNPIERRVARWLPQQPRKSSAGSPNSGEIPKPSGSCHEASDTRFRALHLSPSRLGSLFPLSPELSFGGRLRFRRPFHSRGSAGTSSAAARLHPRRHCDHSAGRLSQYHVSEWRASTRRQPCGHTGRLPILRRSRRRGVHIRLNIHPRHHLLLA